MSAAAADDDLNDVLQKVELEPDDLNDDGQATPQPPRREGRSNTSARAPLRPVRPAPPVNRAASVPSRPPPGSLVSQDEFAQVAKYNILSTAGVDKLSRPVIVFYAHNMPPRDQLDRDLLLRYMKHCFDQVVENHYSIIYFHYGLNSQNKPSLSWLRRVYSGFERKYKKNLQALYVVHATTFFKTVLTLFRPLISSKFGKKITFISTLHDLEPHVHIAQLHVPAAIKRHDEQVSSSRSQGKRRASQQRAAASQAASAAPKSVFGAKLEDIKRIETASGVPVFLLMALTYLRQHALDTEGIFRRSANAVVVNKVKDDINRGHPFDFKDCLDINLPAVLVKSFFRDLQEPVFTYAAYGKVLAIADMPDGQVKIEALRHLMQSLPEQNRNIIKRLFLFLYEVAEHEDQNKMSSSNLAIVFGPNLLWARDEAASLSSMGKINKFTGYLISHASDVFSAE